MPKKHFRYSFSYAIQGLGHVVKHESHARFHLSVAVGVLLLALFLNIQYPQIALSGGETAALLVTVLLVFVSEIMNTAIERLGDVFTSKHKDKVTDQAVGLVKDIMAGAVLVSAAGSVLVGVVVLLPRLLLLFGLI